MSRIRSIKPEFWTDEKVVKLPLAARLMFIGLWNFCDDEGWLADEPDRIQMQIFPGDDLDAGVLVDVLVAAGLLDRIESEDGEPFLVVRNFAEHQRVSNATASKLRPRGTRKLVIPVAVRRGLAKKYGVEPGDNSHPVECFYCGEEGRAWWPNTGRGKTGSWVGFSLEIDHLQPESEGGSTSTDNLVLACRGCNRSKGAKNLFAFSLERSGELPTAPEKKPRKGMEGNGREGSRRDPEIPHTQPLPTAGGMDSADARAARVGSPSAPGNQNGKPSAASGTEPTDDDPSVPATVAAPRPRSGPSGAGNAKSPSMPPHGPPGRIARATDADLQPWFEAVCRGLGQSLTWGPRYVMPTERIVVHAEKHGLTVDQVEAVARHYRVRCKDGTPSFPKFADDIDRWRADWQASRSGGKTPPKTPAQLRAKGVCPEHPGEKLTPAGRCELCDEVALLRKRLGDGSTEAVA